MQIKAAYLTLAPMQTGDQERHLLLRNEIKDMVVWRRQILAGECIVRPRRVLLTLAVIPQ